MLNYLAMKTHSWMIRHHTMNMYCGVEIQFHAFLTSTLYGAEWLASRPSRIKPGERVPVTYWIGV
jgi:hypothetical protein